MHIGIAVVNEYRAPSLKVGHGGGTKSAQLRRMKPPFLKFPRRQDCHNVASRHIDGREGVSVRSPHSQRC